MENPGCPRWQQPARILGWMLGASVMACLGEPVANRPRWQVAYPAATNGKAAESAAVAMSGGPLMVAVVTPGADAAHPALSMGNQKVAVREIGHDPVSSLSFLKVEGGAAPNAMEWRSDAGGVVNAPLQAMTANGPVKCHATGWTQQVGTKILPLALLQVTFEQTVPLPGTPLLDPQGRVAAIVFQSAGTGKVGYAIPAEAVHRVQRDLANGGQLIRGYLGLSLRAEIKAPKVVKVLPNSPAAAAGIHAGDVLLEVGSRKISSYADAANAFFYLIPGQPVQVKLLRGTSKLEVTLTPTRPSAR